MPTRPLLAFAAATLAILCGAGSASAAATPTAADVQSGLEKLVQAPGGPPGAIATIYRDGHLTVLRAGRADIRKPQAPRASDHMRIASVAKAFSGAVALNLVGAGRLGLDDTVGQRLTGMPPAWSAVTVGELLNHTSGVPDYTKSKGFVRQFETNPRGYVSPQKIIGWVRADPLEFAPGSRYEYSNTDNILVGLIAEAVSGESYGALLQRIVFGPAKLSQTSFPTKVALPSPFIHGYLVAPGEQDEDVSTFLSPSGAWASGAIVSTPRNLNAFIRADLGLRFFSAAEQRRQMTFVAGGESSPPGPGRNSAGLALFRYETKCGTVYGHTGNIPGYVQWAAASADGSRAVTTSLNIPAPTGKLLAQLRAVQATAVCALLGDDGPASSPMQRRSAGVPTLASSPQYKALVAYVAKLRGLQAQPASAAQKSAYEAQLTSKHAAAVNKSTALFSQAKKKAKVESRDRFEAGSAKVRELEAGELADLRTEYDDRLDNAEAGYGKKLDAVEAEYDARIAKRDKEIQRLRVQKAKSSDLAKKTAIQGEIAALIKLIGEDKKRERAALAELKDAYAEEKAKIHAAKAAATADIREANQTAIEKVRARSTRAYNNKVATLQLKRTNQLLDLEAKLTEGRAYILAMPLTG